MKIWFSKESAIVGDAITIPDKPTNGDMIKAIFNPFQIIKYTSEVQVYFSERYYQFYGMSWWNAPYKGGIMEKCISRPQKYLDAHCITSCCVSEAKFGGHDPEKCPNYKQENNLISKKMVLTQLQDICNELQKLRAGFDSEYKCGVDDSLIIVNNGIKKIERM